MPSSNDVVRLLVASGVGAAVGQLSADAPLWGAVAMVASVAATHWLARRKRAPVSQTGTEALDPPPLIAITATGLACIALAVAATAVDAEQSWRRLGVFALAECFACGVVAAIAVALALSRRRAADPGYGGVLLGIVALACVAQLAVSGLRGPVDVLIVASVWAVPAALALGVAFGATATARTTARFRSAWLAIGATLGAATLWWSVCAPWWSRFPTEWISWPHLVFAYVGSPILRRTQYDLLVFAAAASRILFALLAVSIAVDRDSSRRSARARWWMWGVLAVEVPGRVVDFDRWHAPYPRVSAEKLASACTLAAAVLGFMLAARWVRKPRPSGASRRGEPRRAIATGR